MTSAGGKDNAHSEDDQGAEKTAVRSTISLFTEGIKRMDAALVARAFHPSATSFSLTSCGVCIEPAERWPEIICEASNNPSHLFHEKFSTRILAVDVVGTAASAKVEWTFETTQILDYYNLLKIGGAWWIVSQVYHVLGRPAAD